MSVQAQIRQMDAEADAAARAEYEQSNAAVAEAAKPVMERGSVTVEVGPEVGADGRPTPAGWRFIGRKLREPMADRDVKERAGRGGRKFKYIDARAVQDRLDAIVGPGNRQTQYFAHQDGAVECTLTIYDVSKADVGYRNNPEAAEGDAQFEHEPLKAAYSDALKRAAVHFGIGRFLYES